MAELFNNLLDKFMAVSWRLLDLPLYVLAIGLLVFFVFAIFLFQKVWSQAAPLPKRLLVAGALAFVLPLTFIFDYKIKLLKGELELINEKYLTALEASPAGDLSMELEPSLRIEDAVEDKIATYFPGLKMWQRPLNPAINMVTLRKENPKAAIYCAIVDLTHPGIQIILTPEYTEEKTFTSVFARKHDCTIAINGEAGTGMHQGSGYGEWVGNWIYKGKAITMLDTDKRPFLSFTQNNKASYSPAKEVVTTPTENMYHAFWGRSDLLVDGKKVPYKNTRPYSRTIMGIDKAGDKLYLMIVDGKRPNYSLGLSFEECAQLLLDLGAYEAMACDQGGSSCIYAKHLNGMMNRPADSDGQERFVYTHFGIKVRN